MWRKKKRRQELSNDGSKFQHVELYLWNHCSNLLCTWHIKNRFQAKWYCQCFISVILYPLHIDVKILKYVQKSPRVSAKTLGSAALICPFWLVGLLFLYSIVRCVKDTNISVKTDQVKAIHTTKNFCHANTIQNYQAQQSHWWRMLSRKVWYPNWSTYLVNA